MNKSITIYLADDHQIIIDGLKLLIGEESQMKIVGSAIDGDTACKEIAIKKPDIALVDLRMPGMTGLDLIHKLKKTLTNTKFIILSMHDSKRYIKDALNSGAAGFLLKNSGRTELLNCLQTVARGDKYFPNLPAAKHSEGMALFTPRELEILKLVLDGRTTAQIATELCLSQHTVDTHRKNICRKANSNTPLGIMKFLQEHQIEL